MKKIVGIIICTLVITAIGVPMAGSMNAIYKTGPEDNDLEPLFQTKSAFSGVGSNLDNWATTPSIDLSGVSSVNLEITTMYDLLPAGDDNGYVKISYTGGSNWTTLKTIQGYNPNWIEMTFDLQYYIDKNVLIAFELKTEAGSISDGWWVQKIVVKADHEDIYYEDFSEYDVGDPWDDWIIAFQTGIPNASPDTPSISGVKNGAAGVEYTYTFISNDLDLDYVSYYVDWGDDSPDTDWVDPVPSGTPVSIEHTFTSEGTYEIKAKAKDIHEEESKWGTLDVTMPKNKMTGKQQLFLIFLERFIERFPLLERIFALH